MNCYPKHTYTWKKHICINIGYNYYNTNQAKFAIVVYQSHKNQETRVNESIVELVHNSTHIETTIHYIINKLSVRMHTHARCCLKSLDRRLAAHGEWHQTKKWQGSLHHLRGVDIRQGASFLKYDISLEILYLLG